MIISAHLKQIGIIMITGFLYPPTSVCVRPFTNRIRKGANHPFPHLVEIKKETL